jgi:hypothetical protein
MAAKTQRWTSCNVLAPVGAERVLWQYSRKGETATLEFERRFTAEEALPADRIGKTFRHTWQPRLNIAWLPPEQVFLRVVELPPAEPAELPALVEFQLEKLSPLPAAQSVWGVEPLPSPPGGPVTVLLLIADRAAVEAHLGTLEQAGYRPDRLELPAVRELLALPRPTDGIVLLADLDAGQLTALTAWWVEGKLRHVSLGRFADNAGTADRLIETLRRTAWAGELEGWLADLPPVSLVAEPTLAARFDAALKDFSGHEVRWQERLSPAQVAAGSATDRTPVNLLPPEVALRYRREFVDRLWMRALGAVALVYVFAVLGYLAYLSILDYQKGSVDHQIALETANHNQALQLRARVEILQEQVNLKFAALDCWKAAAEALPDSMTLSSLTFQRGKKLGLVGSVPPDQQGKVTEYNAALSKATIGGRPLFSSVTTKSIQTPGRPGAEATWSLECEINRRDLP